MTRKVFINKLMKYLKNISDSEREDIKIFYNEMFDDAGIELNDDVPKSFGDPRKIAMEILAENIEMSDDKDKKTSFFKKASLFFLGIFGLPFVLPLFIILLIVGVFAIILSCAYLTISLFKIPFMLFSDPMSLVYFGLNVLIFCFMIWLFVKIVQFMYRRLLSDVSNNADKYTKYMDSKYFKVYYVNDDEDNKDDKDFDDESDCSDMGKIFFDNVSKIDLEVEATNVIIEESETERVIIDSRNLKKAKLNCENENGICTIKTKTTLKNKSVNTFSGFKSIVDESTLKIYIPKNIDIDAEFKISNIKINNVVLKDIKVLSEASNVKVNDIQFNFGEFEQQASKLKGEIVDFEKLYIDCEASNVKLDVDKDEEEIILSHSVSMGSLKFFGRRYAGIVKGVKRENANLIINCDAGSVKIN